MRAIAGLHAHLVHVAACLDGDERGIFKKQFAPLLSDARAALSASARNCDRFATAEEAFNAWESDNKKPPEQCFLQWLFAPAEGGAE